MSRDFEPFNIRHTVRDILDETDLTTPAEIAEKVAEMVPTNQLRTTLATALREYVRVELTHTRARAAQPTRTGGPSAKVTAIRDAAHQWLRQRVCAGDTWKMLGDCTYEDLLRLEQDRREHAQRSAAAAERFAALAALVRKHKAGRVGDLPLRVIEAWQVRQ